MSDQRVRISPSYAILACAPLLFACDPEPLDAQQEPADEQIVEGCAPGDLVGGSVLASETFVRETGKPVDELLEFETEAGEDLCVVVITDHEDGESAAPASLTVELDELEIFGPADFDAHYKSLVRKLEAAAGEHALEIQLRGKPGGRAHVSVLAAPSNPSTEPTLDPVALDRLEDPQAESTVVEDETIVVTESLEAEQAFFAALADLPFPAYVTSRLVNVPIYRVYLPGATGGDDLRARIADVDALSMVESAGVHRVGGVSTESLPKQGDDDYIVHGEEFDPQQIKTHEFSDAAWHLERIDAGRAWTWLEGSPKHEVRAAVMDNGFNLEHPELTPSLGDGLGQCWTEDNDRVVSSDCTSVSIDPPTGSNAPHHGTAVFGVFAAAGGNDSDSFAETVGVSWGGPVDLASYNIFVLTPGEDSLIEDDLDQEGIDETDFIRDSIYSDALVVEQIILGPDPDDASDNRRLINMSFGRKPFRGSTEEPNIDADELLGDNTDDGEISHARSMWRIFLETYDDVLLVKAAGNTGGRCPGSFNVSDTYCTTQARRGPCTVTVTNPSDEPGVVIPEAIADRVLCVQATEDDEGQDLIWARTSTEADPLGAPGHQIDVLSLAGPGLELDRNGTSYAAPQVTGAAALLWKLWPNLTPQQIHEVLIASAAPIGDTDVGRLDIADAIQMIACAEEGAYPNLVNDPSPSFYDLDNHWAEGPVEFLADKCVVEGFEDGRFEPNQHVDREEALKIILELSQPGIDFRSYDQGTLTPDVSDDAWFSGYVRWANEHGLLDTWLDEQGKFNAGDAVDRGPFIRLLVEAAALSSEPEFVTLAETFEAYENGNEDEDEDLDKIDYSDENDPAYIDHEAHIDAATARCIVEGYKQSDAFEPELPLLRGEAAKVGCLGRYGLNNGCKEELEEPCTPFDPNEG